MLSDNLLTLLQLPPTGQLSRAAETCLGRLCFCGVQIFVRILHTAAPKRIAPKAPNLVTVGRPVILPLLWAAAAGDAERQMHDLMDFNAGF